MSLPPGHRGFRTVLGLWSALVFAFLYLPILVLVAYSFNASRLNILWEGFTLKGENSGALISFFRL